MTDNQLHEFIEEMERGYVKHAITYDYEWTKLLPIREKKHVIALIYNLSASKNINKQLSYDTYYKIVDIWISRLTENEK